MDNGVMGRAVERLHNIDEIVEKRSDDDDKSMEAMEIAGKTEEE
jgi:hypothetical protein